MWLFLLNMTGHAHILRNITFISGSLSLIVVSSLTVCWGFVGTVFGVAVSIVVQNGLGAYCVAKYLNINTLGFF